MVATLLLICSMGVVSADEDNESSGWLEKGNAFIQQEKWDEAIATFLAATEQEPENPVAWFKLGGSYLSSGLASEAESAYLKATELDPEYGDAYAMLGFLNLFFRVPPDAAGALEALENAKSTFKDNPGAQINYALANILEKNYDVAKASLEEVIQQDSENARAYYYLGYANSENGNLEEGLEAFNKALEISPTYKDALYAKADIQGLLGLEEDSAKTFDTLISVEGDYAEPLIPAQTINSEVFYRKGVIAYNNENDTDAMKNFDKSIEENPSNHRAQYYRGIILFAQDDLAGARTALEKAVEIKDQFANAWYWLGRIDIKEQNFSSAVENLRKAIEIDEKLTDAWYFLGGIVGDYEESYTDAVTAFTKVTELSPEYADAWYFKGLNEYKSDNLTSSIDSFEQALALTSETFTEDLQANAWYLLGLMQTSEGATEQASESFKEAVTLNASDSVSWNSYGTVLNELNRYEDALKAFEKALDLDDTLAESWFNKGNVLRNLDKAQEALVSYDKAIAIDPQPRVWNSKGMALMKLGKDEEAIEAFDSGLALDDTLAVLWFNKAGALTNLERYDEAMEAVDKALTLDPEYASALTLKEQITAKMGSTGGESSKDEFVFTPDEAINNQTVIDESDNEPSMAEADLESEENLTADIPDDQVEESN